MKIVVNEQIHLSEFQPADEAVCVAHLKDKEIYDRTLRIPYPYSAADFHAWLQIVAATTRQQGRTVQWAIRNGQGTLIGGIGLDDFQLGKSHRAEIGYWLARPYRGRGIMTGVVRTVCDLAIAEFGLVKITAHVFASNGASVRVLEKNGFVHEGFLRKHYWKDGQFFDAWLLARISEP